MTIIVMAAVMALSGNAQSAAYLADQQQSLNDIMRKALDAKPTKDVKKQAKALQKEGWKVPAGERSIEQQISESQFLSTELMANDEGTPVKRFIQHTAISTAKTYNAAYAAARSNAQVEIATMLGTELAAAMQGKIDNAQQDAASAVTVDKYDQRVKSIVHQSLTNAIPVLAIYRMLPNNTFEVQARIAYDKKEVGERIKRSLQKELEIEGDRLNGIVDNALNIAL